MNQPFTNLNAVLIAPDKERLVDITNRYNYLKDYNDLNDNIVFEATVLDVYYTINEDGVEKLIISEEALEDLLNCDEEFSKEEDIMIGKMIYNLEYCCAYLFY